MEAINLDHVPVNDTCIICDEKKDSGIYICNQLICHSCQKKIVETDVDDATYELLVKQLKKLSVTVHSTLTESNS
ncbi:sigma factor G inhibitor Gin [Pullulanibacillus sp. KACC 23026]|uniref:sigma factor G inhibitor Gin n=1 Tax=Pullulanibacillus sp. KACC 23026 TaxID=3028315 RepID=UPI0023AEDD94|nr:sigma factor G inhibitor Gin [Pullulanibacillus sp. KACC 23026]WEG12755.1 sigma factor G inhibitor Gin [Pullulanibacillus sp. KACC 23026]